MLLLLLLVHILSTSGRPVISNPLNSRAPPESCDDIDNCRRMVDIIWGCLATIFACTWVSVHPNVPPPNQSCLVLFWRRLKLMLITVIAPELIVGFAARQFFAARSYANDFKISRTHGFFICMGGFVSHIGHHPIVTDAQFQGRPEFLSAIRAVEEEAIKDKSKGDALSKGITLVQGLWFTTQCLARVHQCLPITELEVATLAFAVVNIFIYALWWGKPLDVQQPIPVQPSDPLKEGDQPDNSVMDSVPEEYDKLWRDNFKNAFLGATTLAKYIHAFLIECLVGTIFGAIHSAAWNAEFPSAMEKWMWRPAALLVAVLPAILAFIMSVAPSLERDSAWYKIGNTVLLFVLALYPIARLVLVALPFIARRDPPFGALKDVNWSMYIPHP